MKLVGFLIGKNLSPPDIDFCNAELTVDHVKFLDFDIYLWGIGDIQKCKIDNKYSFSFPLTDSLLDRNLLIYFNENSIVIENDWLGSIPVFYNPKKMIVSTIPNFCISDKSIHEEGLANFCDFGYSVFEQTLFDDVKFLRFYSKLTISKDNINVEYKEDVISKVDFTKEEKVDHVLELIAEYIKEKRKLVGGYTIIPLSGGYDSRLLSYFHPDKDTILGFTYGISKRQDDSFEVAHAREISKILKIKWSQVRLENFLNTYYINKWFNIYGISTHLHGMYHIEFYNKIRENIQSENYNGITLLSGIFGDVWAGSVRHKEINCSTDLVQLGYTHGLRLDTRYLVKIPKFQIREDFFNTYKVLLKEDIYKTIFTVRIKIILISYLTIIPEYFGWPVWTPFLNFEIATKMLNLPAELRTGRVWQRKFFSKVGLNVEELVRKKSFNNQLDEYILKNSSLDLLDVDTLSEIFQKKRIVEINKILSMSKSYVSDLVNIIYSTWKIGGLLRRLGLNNPLTQALNEYYVLKTIELALRYKFKR